MILLTTSLCAEEYFTNTLDSLHFDLYVCQDGFPFKYFKKFSFCFLGSQRSGGTICTIHLLIETIDLLIHTNGPPASSIWLPVYVSHPKKKPPSAAALVMGPDFASLVVL